MVANGVAQGQGVEGRRDDRGDLARITDDENARRSLVRLGDAQACSPSVRALVQQDQVPLGSDRRMLPSTKPRKSRGKPSSMRISQQSTAALKARALHDAIQEEAGIPASFEKDTTTTVVRPGAGDKVTASFARLCADTSGNNAPTRRGEDAAGPP